MVQEWEEAIEQLTLQAVRASEQGRWDTVDLCYQRRLELFRAHDVSNLLAGRLHSLDAQVHDRLRLATMAVQHLLTEVAVKQRLVGRFEPTSECEVSSNRSGGVSRRV